MPVFLLSFDLNHEEGYAHYGKFTEELQKMRGYRVMNNAALVNVKTTSARVVLEHLKPFLEDTDRIFAVRMTSENSYFLHAYPETNEWLKQNPLDGPPAGVSAAEAQPVQ